MNPSNTVDQAPDISSENVKEQFYKWFESRGLLSELRSHMRQLMVKALEESNKNGNLSVKNRKSAASPKLQAINLLVVDYLFHEDYLYTVSVFASEAQILDSLPQYSRYVTETVRQRRWEPSSLPRFSAQETEDILDTLRLPGPGRDTRQAMQAYLSGSDSLLTCVVRALASHQNHGLTMSHLEGESCMPQETSECNHQLWSQEMQNLLLLAGVKLHHIKRMQQKWAQIIEEERCRAVQEAEEATEERLRSEILEQLRAEQAELRERRSRVELREQGLTSLAEQLTAVHDDISQRLSQIQVQSNELQEREARLEERLCREREREEQAALQASLKEQSTLLHTEVVKEDQEKLIDSASESSLQTSKDYADVSVQVCVTEDSSGQVQGVVAETQTADPVVTAYTQTVDTEDQEQQTSACVEHDQQLILQLQTDRERINELQEENLELRAHALQQRHRIDELTNRAASLSSQLEDARVAITVLSGQESAVVPVTTPAPPPARPRTPPFMVPTFGYNTPQRKGAGEESLFTPRPQQVIPRSDGRRRSLRYAFSQNPTPTSEESSPTDEVIQNARARIRQLEEESAAVQRNYQEFHNRLVTTDSVMFPPLGTSRIRDPLIRMRRSEVLPFNPLSIIPQQFNRCFRARPEETRDEGNEESSSDQALLYESSRIEHLTNSRRLFSQRNIRQFDRWKQFKKKFQRRDHNDHRRNVNLIQQSNTSSDDDEPDLRQLRRRHEINSTRRTSESQRLAAPVQQQTCEPQAKNEKESNNQEKLQMENTQSIEQFENFRELTPLVLPTIKETPVSKIVESQQPTQDLINMELRLKSEVERSVKLIESVRCLLETQNNPIPPKSTLSNGSLAVESLPRDSSQDDVHITENVSVLTIQSAKQVEYSDRDLPNNIQELEPSLVQTSTVKETVQENISTTIVYNRNVEVETLPDLLLQHTGEEGGHELGGTSEVEEIHPTPLTVPSLRLVSPLSGLNAEDWLATVAVTSSDVAEHDSGDRATSSVTSASDILRELNPLKKESSDSVISAGWADDSRHSSDFWN